MFADTMSAAIDAARTLTRLDHLVGRSGRGSRPARSATTTLRVWQSACTPVGASLRGEIKPVGIPPGRPSIFPPRRLPAGSCAACGDSPTPAPRGERADAAGAGLQVHGRASWPCCGSSGDEVRGQGACARTIDEIAARAGTCRRMVQNAIRQAAALGLLTVQERRREGQKNLPNVLRVVSREWLSWLRIGCKKIHPTDNKEEKKARPIGRKGLPIKEGAGHPRLEPFPARMGQPTRRVASMRRGRPGCF